MDKIILQAEKRTLTGKKVKNMRIAGKVPAILYGDQVETTPISLDKRNTTNILNKFSGSTILTIEVEGEQYATLVREIQQDYLKNELLHVDFLAVSLKDKLRTTVSISLIGVAPVLEEFSALIVSGIDQIEVECLPQDLPEVIEVDISALSEIGSAIYMKDIPTLPDVDFLTDPEELIAVASAVKEEVIEEEEEEELLDVDSEDAEPEVVEHGKKEEESESEEKNTK
jgi:large subunit ribosomal protein L25